jgi:hypothetical protein
MINIFFYPYIRTVCIGKGGMRCWRFLKMIKIVSSLWSYIMVCRLIGRNVRKTLVRGSYVPFPYIVVKLKTNIPLLNNPLIDFETTCRISWKFQPLCLLISADVFLCKIIDERQISLGRWCYRNARQENQWRGQVGNKVFAKISVEFL